VLGVIQNAEVVSLYPYSNGLYYAKILSLGTSVSWHHVQS
jgi:hypothetical protein